MIVPVPSPYHLRRTLECGQVFRWSGEGTAAVGVYRGRAWRVQQQNGYLEVAGGESEDDVRSLCEHLGLSAPLALIEERLGADRVLRRVLPHTTGIAIMQQDLWESLISFVISAFNNIPKIRLAVEHLSRRFGERIAEGVFAFPSPEQLATARLPALRACILGYRAPYVRQVARAVADGLVDLDALRAAPLDDARDVLLGLPGVGEKVADCVLLFALGHGGAFPVDVWVQRAVEGAYLKGRRASPRAIREWAQERFGALAGYANQHLFTAARQGLISL
jgi:N-glycosylase/DNA lyase